MQEMTPADKKVLREKKRKKTMLVRRLKVSAVLCFVLVGMLYVLSAFVLFKIENIEICGVEDENGKMQAFSSYYTKEEIIKVSGIETGDSLVRLDKEEIEETIKKILPYIGSVTLKRVYPSTVQIITEDTHAVYGADSGGGYTLLDETFKVLNVVSKLPKNCVKITGFAFENATIGSEAVLTDESLKTRVQTIVRNCNDAGIINLTKIELSNIANIKIVISNRVTMILGTTTDLAEKLSLGVKTMDAENKNSSNKRIIIDISNPERSYVSDDFSPVENDDYAQTTKPEENNAPVPEEDIPDAVG